jgi:hypothetical protein
MVPFSVRSIVEPEDEVILVETCTSFGKQTVQPNENCCVET